MRLGWLTAHSEVINKVLFHSHGVAMGPCSFSQVCHPGQSISEKHRPTAGLATLTACIIQPTRLLPTRPCSQGLQRVQAALCAQVVVAALLDRWGRAGFEAHIKDIQAQYARRAGIIHAAAKKHLTGLATWAEPRAGMFLWVRLLGFEDAAQILSQLREARVIVVPGARLPTPTLGIPSPVRHSWPRMNSIHHPVTRTRVPTERPDDTSR